MSFLLSTAVHATPAAAASRREQVQPARAALDGSGPHQSFLRGAEAKPVRLVVTAWCQMPNAAACLPDRAHAPQLRTLPVWTLQSCDQGTSC